MEQESYLKISKDQIQNCLTPIVVIGRLGRFYGIHGWIRVQSYTQSLVNILKYKTWYLLEKGTVKQHLRVVEGRLHPTTHVVVAALAGYNSPEAVATLSGCEIGVYRDALPALSEGEYYWTDLIGMDVINESIVLNEPAHSRMIGTVRQIIETRANQLLIISKIARSITNKYRNPILVPFLMNQYVKAVDLQSRCIRIDWPEWFE